MGFAAIIFLKFTSFLNISEPSKKDEKKGSREREHKVENIFHEKGEGYHSRRSPSQRFTYSRKEKTKIHQARNKKRTTDCGSKRRFSYQARKELCHCRPPSTCDGLYHPCRCQIKGIASSRKDKSAKSQERKEKKQRNRRSRYILVKDTSRIEPEKKTHYHSPRSPRSTLNKHHHSYLPSALRGEGRKRNLSDPERHVTFK